MLNLFAYLSKTLYPVLSTGSARESRKTCKHNCKIVDWDVTHQQKQKKNCLIKQAPLLANLGSVVNIVAIFSFLSYANILKIKRIKKIPHQRYR